MSTPLDKFRLDSSRAVLIVGDSGAGKSNFLLEWPDPWILDWDGNMANAIERHPGKVGWITSAETNDGMPVPPEKVYERCLELIKLNAPRKEVKSLCFDGLTRLCICLKDLILFESCKEPGKDLVVGGEKMMTEAHWGPFQQKLGAFFKLVRGYGKPVIMTAHLNSKYEKKTNQYLGDMLAVQGAMGRLTPGFFTDVWQACVQMRKVKEKQADGTEVEVDQSVYYVRTQPTGNMKQLKCSCDLPIEVEFTQAKYEAHMRLRAEWRSLVEAYASPNPTWGEAKIRADFEIVQRHSAVFLAMPDGPARQAQLAPRQALGVKMLGLLEKFKQVTAQPIMQTGITPANPLS